MLLKRVPLIMLFLLLASMLWGAIFIWRSPPYAPLQTRASLPVPIMPAAEYDPAAHPLPYVLQLSRPETAGALLFFGSRHTDDPQDPQIEQIQAAFTTFKPTVVLVEGRLGFLIPGLMDPVETFNEMGAVNQLARRVRLPVYSWELSREQEVERMLALQPYTAEKVALMYMLSPYLSQRRFGRPADPDAAVEAVRTVRVQYPGLEGTFENVAAIDAVWARDFEGLPDWRDTSDEHGLPGYLAELAAQRNKLRNEHLVQIILEMTASGERVFVIAGASHSVQTEPALRAFMQPAP